MSDTRRVAGVELGGTKAFAVLWQEDTIINQVRVPTGEPDSTLDRLIDLLAGWWQDGPFAALGVASFGPVTLDRSASDFGCIRSTPKAGWTGAPVVPPLARRFPCPIAIDTDVNAAAMAEYRWGHGRGASSLVYLTIGTGVGGGVLLDGRPLHGRLHPELGHLRLRRQPGDTFAGACRFHRDCAEGLLSGPALLKRFGVPPEQVLADDPRWQVVARDLAEFVATLIHSLAPNRILIGGGVGMGAPWLTDRLPALLVPLLGGYYPEIDESVLAALVTHPALGDAAGPLGAIAVGLAALDQGSPGGLQRG